MGRTRRQQQHQKQLKGKGKAKGKGQGSQGEPQSKANKKRRAHDEDEEPALTSPSPSSSLHALQPPLCAATDTVSKRSFVGGPVLAVGLRNLGNTCYLNSVLQLLVRVAPLRAHYALRPASLPPPLERDLAKALRQTLTRMHVGATTGNAAPVSPSDVYSAVKARYASFRGNGQQDAEELYRRLLEALIDDAKAVDKKARQLLDTCVAPDATARDSDAAEKPAEKSALDEAQRARLERYALEQAERGGVSVEEATFAVGIVTRVQCLLCGTVTRTEESDALDVQLSLPLRCLPASVRPTPRAGPHSSAAESRKPGTRTKQKRLAKRERLLAARRRALEEREKEVEEEKDSEGGEEDDVEEKGDGGDAETVPQESPSPRRETAQGTEPDATTTARAAQDDDAQAVQAHETRETDAGAPAEVAEEDAKVKEPQMSQNEETKEKDMEKLEAHAELEESGKEREDAQEEAAATAECAREAAAEDDGAAADSSPERTHVRELTELSARVVALIEALQRELRPEVLAPEAVDARPRELAHERASDGVGGADACSVRECLAVTTAPELLDDFACYACTRRALEHDPLALALLMRHYAREERRHRHDHGLAPLEDEESMSAPAHSTCVPLLRGRAVRQTLLRRTGPLVALHLKRFGYAQKLHTALVYPLALTLDAYAEADEPGRTAPRLGTYRLLGLSCHSGSLGGGHYTAIVRTDNQWYHISDTHVKRVDQSAALQARSTAYLLFYERAGPDATEEEALRVEEPRDLERADELEFSTEAETSEAETEEGAESD